MNMKSISLGGFDEKRGITIMLLKKIINTKRTRARIENELDTWLLKRFSRKNRAPMKIN